MTPFSRLSQNVVSLAVVIFIISTATAQTTIQQILNSPEEVAEVISGATSEILMVTNVLRAVEVADALREALAVRGVPVYILIPPDTVEENASYAASLAHAGASVRLSEVGGSFLVIDRRVTIAGPLIGNLSQMSEGMPTVYIDEPTYAAQFVEGFIQSFEAAQVYTPVGQQ